MRKLMKSSLRLVPAFSEKPQAFRHSWEELANIDQFHWMTRADVLEQLEMAHDELGVRHVRAAGMFDDKMRVWAYGPDQFHFKQQDRFLRTNYQIIDYVMDRLLKKGVRPMYTTCFMPSRMANGESLLWDRSYSNPPKDHDEWKDFVTQSVRHAYDRYGADEVRQWYFEVWNEPNLNPPFFAGTQEDFFKLWSVAFHAIKAVDPQLRVGGPSTARGDWCGELLDFARKDGSPPDYIITHCYNNDSESEPLVPFDGPASFRVKDSPHFLTGVVRGVKKLMEEKKFTGEVHWNEWGRSWFPHDPQKETPLEAAFVCKSMSQVSQDATYFAYWCLSDVYDQAGYNRETFRGHYGLLNLQGLRKPAYVAHQLLHRLGYERFPCSGGSELEGAIATRSKDGKQQILVYRYPEDVKSPVERGRVEVVLPRAPKLCRVFRITERENNILAYWREMGAPDYLSPGELRDLQGVNHLTPSLGAVTVEEQNGQVVASFDLETPGVALLEVS
jgi:xylan 1,4-beta-xylosidase